jgi:DNA-binding CsgD family transcriptional regulator
MNVGDDGATLGSAARFDQALRASALREEGNPTTPFDLSELWRELGSGRCKVADSFHSETRCYLVLVPAAAEGSHRRRPNSRGLYVLERLLLEGSQKGLALSLGVSTSTVAGVTKDCLFGMGLRCSPSKVPPLLVMAAHAEHGHVSLAKARSSQLFGRDGWFRVISAMRPDRELGGLLSSAELAVARLLVDGKSHAEIARLRGSSLRTVANQLAAVFQRLGVSGRADLLRALSVGPSGCEPANGNAQALPSLA